MNADPDPSARHDQPSLAAERRRILAENERRQREIPADRYDPASAAEGRMRLLRRLTAERLLAGAGISLTGDSCCLEVGCGSGGWLPDLLSWGARPSGLWGVEIDPRRATAARRAAGAHILLADGGRLPFAAESFHLVVSSTVLTSILELSVRAQVASEIQRCLRPAGALLWYDFRYDNPTNRNVRGIGRRQLMTLFPDLEANLQSVTLLPPLARLFARWPSLVAGLERLPVLRSHLVGGLRKPVAAAG